MWSAAVVGTCLCFGNAHGKVWADLELQRWRIALADLDTHGNGPMVILGASLGSLDCQCLTTARVSAFIGGIVGMNKWKDGRGF